MFLFFKKEKREIEKGREGEKRREREGGKEITSEFFCLENLPPAERKPKKNLKKNYSPHEPFPLPPNQDGSHSVQCVNCLQETAECPSRLGSSPKTLKKLGHRYHAAKTPTVAHPT